MTLPGGAGKALAALGIETVGDLLEHLPHAHRDRRDVRQVAELALGEEATVAVAVRSVTVKPMRNRRRKRVEARVADESGPAAWRSGSTSPGSPASWARGRMLLLHGKLRRRGEFWVTEHELLGGSAAPVHTVGLVPVHPATEGITAARLRELVWDHYRTSSTWSSRCPRRCARRSGCRTARPRWRRRTSPIARRTSAGRDGGSRSRSCSCSSSPWPGAAAPGARAGGRGRSAARGVVVDRWRWSLPFELTGDQQRADRARSTPTSTRERPMQRLLMGEVGCGQDRGGARGDAARGRERRARPR